MGYGFELKLGPDFKVEYSVKTLTVRSQKEVKRAFWHR